MVFIWNTEVSIVTGHFLSSKKIQEFEKIV